MKQEQPVGVGDDFIEIMGRDQQGMAGFFQRQDLAEAKLPLRPAGGGRGAARRLAFEDFAVC